MAQVVPGVVLRQIFVQIEDIPLAGDHFQTSHPVPAHAVADYLDTTGVGGEVAAKLAGTGRGEIHGIIQAVVFGVGLQLFRHYPGLTLHGAVAGAEVQNLVHVVKRHHNLTIGRHGSGTQAGAPTRRHQSHLVLVGKPHQRLHLFRRLGQNNGHGLGWIDLRPVLAVIFQVGRVSQHFSGGLARFHQGFEGGNDLFRIHG